MHCLYRIARAVMLVGWAVTFDGLLLYTLVVAVAFHLPVFLRRSRGWLKHSAANGTMQASRSALVLVSRCREGAPNPRIGRTQQGRLRVCAPLLVSNGRDHRASGQLRSLHSRGSTASLAAH